MKKTFLFTTLTLLLVVFGVQSVNAQKLKGVEINGVIWAIKNVGAKKAEDYGKYYTWNEAQTVCPKGWRVPTKEEFESLENAGSVWTTQNGKDGRNFGDGNNIIFLPAAGHSDSSDGTLGAAGQGCYWSSTNVGFEHALHFNSYNAHICGGKTFKFSVRCVKE